MVIFLICFQLKLNLIDASSRPAGQLLIRAEEAHATNNFVTLQFSARKLDKKDWSFFGSKSDPFMTVSRVKGSGEVVVYKSEVLRKTVDPQWRPFTVPVQALCNNDYERPLIIRVRLPVGLPRSAKICLFPTKLK
jgi:hypothetical protein